MQPTQAPFAPLYAADGMVCTVDHHATGAGVAVLRAGGSAADAAIAAGLVLAVTTQHMRGLGGDLLAVVHRHGEDPVALDAGGRAGSGADPDRLRSEGHAVMPAHGDIRSVPVPGCVDGWVALHERFGRLDLEQVLVPAARWPRTASRHPSHSREPRRALRGVTMSGSWRARLRRARSSGAPASPGCSVHWSPKGRDGVYLGEFGEGLLDLGDSGFTTWDARGDVIVQLKQSASASWDALAALGHHVRRASGPDARAFGHAHVIRVVGDALEGAAEPRALGGSAADC